MFKRMFWNPDEKRLRTLWRLILQVVMIPLTAIPLIPVFLILGLGGIQIDTHALLEINNKTSIAPMLTILGSVVLAGYFLDKRKFSDFGFHFSRKWWTDLAFGFLLSAGLMAGIFLIEYALGWVSVTGMMLKSSTPESFWVELLLMLLLFFFVGSYEELLSRGYHIKNLSEGLNLKKRNPTAAILSATLISSAVFSLLHVFNPNATWVSTLCIVLSGLFLAAGYILTGDLALSIGIHTAWNFFQGNVFGFPVSGRNAGVTLLAIEQRGPDLITGGQFGPESGLIGIAAILLGCGILVLYVRRHYGRAGLRTELAVPNFQTKHLSKTSDSQKDAAQGTTDNVRKDKI